MAEDLRRLFSVKNCAGATAAETTDNQKRKDFFNDIGKLGDIEVLNRIPGAGKITSGLRSLAKISNMISLGETDSAIIPNSSGYVFDAVGINLVDATRAGGFNPGVLNRATGQADTILHQVKQGLFTIENIPNSVGDFQSLASTIAGIYTPGKEEDEKSMEICGATPYAIDLVRFAPKFKFLFILQFTVNEQYNWMDLGGDSMARNLAFVVKHSTRPNVAIEHEEINMYNFWTDVPKRVRYEPMTMRFYDDNKGLAHLFYTSYLNIISPISREQDMPADHNLLAATSMPGNTRWRGNSSSLGVLENDNVSIIKEIKLFHVYDYGKFMNVYNFKNPKLTAMNLDELDMAETGGGSEFELQFVYDAMTITSGFNMNENKTKVVELTTNGSNPMVPNFTGTIAETPEGTGEDGEAPIPNKEKSAVDELAADVKMTKDSVTGGIQGVYATASETISDAAEEVTSVYDNVMDSAEEMYGTASGAVTDAYNSTSDFIGSSWLS